MPIGVFAQGDPYAVSLGIEEGLPSNNIYEVFQDSKGFIWFASDVGVIHYDGYDFAVYNTDEGLSDNEVFKMYEDSKGRIWFLTLNGRLSYFLDGQLFNEENDPLLQELSGQNMVVDLLEHNNALYVLFRSGGLHVLHSNQEITIIPLLQEHSYYGLFLIEDEPVVLNSRELQWLNQDRRIALPQLEKKNLIHRVALTYEQTPIISINQTLYRLNGSQWDAFFEVAPTNEILSLDTTDENLWIGTRTGAYMFSNQKLKHYFPHLSVSSYLKDREGNIWLSTLNAGVLFIPSIHSKVYELGIPNGKIKCLFQKRESDTLLMGTDQGLYYFNKASGVIASYGSLYKSTSYVRNIKAQKDSLWVLGSTTSMRYGPHIDNYYFSINDLVPYRDGYVTATPSNTYYLTNQDLESLKQFQKKLPDEIIYEAAILTKRSNCLVRAKDIIYIGTNSGLYAFSNGKVAKVAIGDFKLNFGITDLYYDASHQQLFIATNSNGIIILNKDGAYQRIGMNKGLNSNHCNQIVPLANQRYLIASSKGLNLLNWNPKKITVKNLNQTFGIKKTRLVDVVSFDEDIIMATEDALIRLPLNNILSPKRPKMYLSSFLVNGQAKSIHSPLAHDENTVTLSYTGLSFSDYSNLQYFYKFGSEKEWTTTQNRQLDFKNMAPGKYEIALKAVNSYGLESDPLLINFSITPPFWKRLPSIAGISFLIFFIAFLIVKKRIQVYKQKVEREKQILITQQEKAQIEKRMVELEQKTLRLQMNPHFIFNALNTIKGYYTGGEVTEANKYIVKFSKLLRLILESNDHLISLEREIEMLELYIALIALRYPNTFLSKIYVDPSISIETTGIPPMLLQPLVENAIIHGLSPLKGNGTLEIRFEKRGNQLVCKVMDNGVGITKKPLTPDNKQSMAISITRERINFLNQNEKKENLTLASVSPHGTLVTLCIPIIDLWD